ncbi:MAG: sulfatase [Thermomicrobiales bacterium]|nr:sulfatase [Thermomicrobiales bacterium]
MSQGQRGFRGGLILLTALLALGMALPMAAVFGAPKPRSNKPNIILILTDDQDYDSIQYLPRVQQLAAQGVSFSNFLATTPICCPSRVTFLRGQYVHNHNVRYNASPGGAFPQFHKLNLDRSTVATWMQQAGYRTGFYGKFLNAYPQGVSDRWMPKGWNDWAAIKRGHYVNFTLNVNGKAVNFGASKGKRGKKAKKSSNYTTRVLGKKANNFIVASAKAKQPFFIQISTQAAHTPLVPEARFRNLFAGVLAPRTSAFGVKPSDPPAWVQGWPGMTDARAAKIDSDYRKRLQTLMSVDTMLGQLQKTLRKTGQANNTYIIFTSDNGWLAGAHNVEGKQSAYTESIRVPLIISGPGVQRGVQENRIVLNTDIGPTIAALGGAKTPGWVDGRSIVPLLRGEDPGQWRTGALIEYWQFPGKKTLAWDGDLRSLAAHGPLPPDYKALRTEDMLYVEYSTTGEHELYDLETDPDSLTNLYNFASGDLKEELQQGVEALANCKAQSCRDAENNAPTPDLPEP